MRCYRLGCSVTPVSNNLCLSTRFSVSVQPSHGIRVTAPAVCSRVSSESGLESVYHVSRWPISGRIFQSTRVLFMPRAPLLRILRRSYCHNGIETAALGRGVRRAAVTATENGDRGRIQYRTAA